LQFIFEGERTIVRRTNIAGVQDFAAKVPLWERMKTLLQNGAVTVATIAEELQVPEASVRQTLKRDADKAGKRTTIPTFTRVEGGLIGLLERRVR
jgi:sirohydrochlorin ferrochelatase